MNNEIEPYEEGPKPKRKLYDDDDHRALKGGFYGALGNVLGSGAGAAIIGIVVLVLGVFGQAHMTSKNSTNQKQ